MKYLPWIFGIGALWLIGAPFYLEYTQVTPALYNDLAVGITMLCVAAYWMYSNYRGGGQHGRMLR